MPMKEYISATKEKIKQVVDLFYQQKNQEGYQELIKVIDSLSEIIALMEKEQSNLELVEKNNKLLYSLNNVTDAMINKDTVLQADILNYEITDILDEIAEIIK
jgi:KaiC/GvpD/RAD55 family RecA-like ATPase